MHIAHKDLTVAEALSLTPCISGRPRYHAVMVERRAGKFRHYTAYHRARDGQLLYRGGSLVRAVATYTDGEFSHVVFYAWEK